MQKILFDPQKIRIIREEKGLAFKDIKKVIGLHHKAQLEQWETGKTTPKADKIALLADLFGVPPCYFYTRYTSAEMECGCKE